MSVWIAAVSAGSAIILAVFAPFVSLNRFMISLGKEERQLDRLIKYSLLRQHSIAFKLVIAGGVVAGLLIVACVVLLLWVPSATAADKVFAALCAIGDSALFRYYLQVWRESGEALHGPVGHAG